MMKRPISSLKIPHLAKLKLQEKGFHYCEDLVDALRSNPELPKSVKLIIETYNVLKQINTEIDIKTAKDLLESQCKYPHIAVFHKGLDRILNGGLLPGRIVEICGAPGSGKTQICYQLAVDVQVPVSLGGSSGKILFISTDLSFRSERIREIASATVEHCSKAVKLQNFSVESILQNIDVIQVQGVQNFTAAIVNVKDLFAQNENAIKLLVIDSFSLPLVCGFDDLLKRTKLIYDLLDVVQDLALKYKFAVVVTNQLTTFVGPNSEKKLVPSLSEGFGHRMHERLLISNGKIYVIKSVSHKVDFVDFVITKSGIR